MPIKGLTDQPRAFVELGQLRKGAPKPKNKPQPGEDLTYFRATFNEGEQEAAKTFYAEYGDEPRAIEVFLPFDEPGPNFETWKEAYLAGGLIHRCDGEYIQYAVDHQSGEVLVQNGTDASGNPVECNGEPVAYWTDKQGKEQAVHCKPEGRLKVIVPALRRLAYMTVLTHSIWDIVNLSSQLEGYWWENNQKLRGIRFVLKRRPKMISTPSGTGGKRARRKKWLLHIEPAPSWVEEQLLMLEEAARPKLLPARGALELPPGVPDTNGDTEIVEPEEPPFTDEMDDDGSGEFADLYLEGVVLEYLKGEMALPDWAVELCKTAAAHPKASDPANGGAIETLVRKAEGRVSPEQFRAAVNIILDGRQPEEMTIGECIVFQDFVGSGDFEAQVIDLLS